MADDGLSIRDRMASELTEGFDKASTVISSHAGEIIGSSLGGLIDDVKNMASGALDFVQGSFKTLFGMGGKDTDEMILDEQEQQTGLLASIKDIFKRQEKSDMAEFGKGDNSIMGEIFI